MQEQQPVTIGEMLARRVREVRQARGLPLRELERRLDAVGHALNATGLKRLEEGRRRTTVEDLIALAVVLDVSPDALVTPLEDSERVEIPGLGVHPAVMVRDWFAGRILPVGKRPSEITEEDIARAGRWRDQRPRYLRRAGEVEGAGTLAVEPDIVLRVLGGASGGFPLKRGAVAGARLALERIRAAVDLLLASEELKEEEE